MKFHLSIDIIMRPRRIYRAFFLTIIISKITKQILLIFAVYPSEHFGVYKNRMSNEYSQSANFEAFKFCLKF